MSQIAIITGTRIRPERGTQKDVHQCRRCGIDYKYDYRRANATHCKDCRTFIKDAA